MKLIFIRHGQTQGNAEGRYLGKTDEPLCPEGIEYIKKKVRERGYPEAEIVWSSPMKRCLQTARLIYPDADVRIEEDLRECDFGKFEYKNYVERSQDEEYRAWVNSGGTLPFPGGEDADDFRRRSREAFLRVVRQYEDDDVIAFAVHGGTMMSVFSKFEEPPSGYFDRQPENGCGYICEFDKAAEKLTVLQEI